MDGGIVLEQAAPGPVIAGEVEVLASEANHERVTWTETSQFGGACVVRLLLQNRPLELKSATMRIREGPVSMASPDDQYGLCISRETGTLQNTVAGPSCGNLNSYRRRQ